MTRAEPLIRLLHTRYDVDTVFGISGLRTVEERLPVIVLLWHNAGYEEIRRVMEAHDVPRLGVDIQAPNFQQLATGFGCAVTRVDSPAALAEALAERARSGPLLIEVDAHRWQQQLFSRG